MRCEKIISKGNYSLIIRGKDLDEYAVVTGFDEERGDWDWTVSYSNFGKYGNRDQFKSFQYCYEELQKVTIENYISRPRLEELATLFKDGLLEDDEQSAMEYFEDTCEMKDSEYEYFGIDNENEW